MSERLFYLLRCGEVRYPAGLITLSRWIEASHRHLPNHLAKGSTGMEGRRQRGAVTLVVWALLIVELWRVARGGRLWF